LRKVGFVKKVERPFCYINVLIKVDICTKIGLDEYIKNLDKGYDTKLDEPNINSIIKQLLSIARILIKNSKIMLFDESIDILDIKTRKK
jgi:ABC-type multidrug transport system fused ATPase/permease subunit